jgi:hypothetical protein
MHLRRRLFAAGAIVALSLAAVAVAQEQGTKDEARAMVDAAVEHVKKVGPEQAFKDFTTDKATWTKKVATKTSYIRTLANDDGWVAVGIFP